MSQKRFLKSMSALVVLMGLMLASSMLMAQSTTTGAVSGQVTDASGAVVAGAKVEVRNTGTNDLTTATSDKDGYYRANNLTPGSYEVKVSSANFADAKATCTVEVGRFTPVDMKLVAGGRSETIEVKDEAPVINTEHQDFANNINQTDIQNLPSNGRRWSSYALSTPTANPDGTFGLISFRGISGLLNNNTIDGGDNNSNFYGEERGRTRLSYSVSQDSVQEFQVNTSNFSSEYGRSAGGAVNTVTKSGTNAYHGSGYWYIRDNGVGATNPSTIINGLPAKPDDRRQQFGATIGGPIVKNRAFFFFNWDQQKRNFPGTAVPLTGTNAYGQITAVATPAEPTNTTPATATSPAIVNPALAAGQCPSGAAYGGGFPTANTTNGVATTPYTLGNAIYCRFGANLANAQAASDAGFNFITSLLGSNARTGDQLIFFPKIDLRVGKGNWSTSYNWLNWTSPFGIQTQPSNTIAKDQFGSDLVRSRSLNSTYNVPVGQSALEMRFHWSTENLSGDFQDPIAGQPLAAGPTGSHPPGVFITNWLNLGTQTYLPRPFNPQEDQYQESISYLTSKGKHTIKFGGEVLHQGEEVQSLSNAYGTFNYTGTFAYADYLSDAFNGTTFTGSGSRLCRSVVVTPATPAGVVTSPSKPCYSSFTQGIGTLGYHFKTNDYAFFLQDDYRIMPKLNLNLGVRYEYQGFPSSQFANTAASQTSNKPGDNNNIGPRVGFAYDILGNGKLVFRGGYGLYYARIINSTVAAALVNTGVANSQPSFSISPSATSTLYPNILLNSTGLSVGTPNIAFFKAGVTNPMIHEFDGILEYEFAKNTVASFSYLKSMGRGLQDFLDTNLPTTYQGTNTFKDASGNTLFTIPTYGTLARPNTSFQQMTEIDNAVDTDYDGYVFQVTRRMTGSLQVQGSYTYSKSLDNGQNSVTFSTGNNALDPANVAAEQGRSNFDVPHKFVFDAIWQPNYFKNDSKFAHYLLDGWSLAPIVNLSSGSTYSPTISGSLGSAFCAGSHSGGPGCASGSSRLPNVERNSLRTSGRYTTDYRMSRMFDMTEKAKVEFLAEAFNLFNHPNISSITATQYLLSGCAGSAAAASCTLTPNSNFGLASAGGIDNGTNLRERQIQFAIRVKF